MSDVSPSTSISIPVPGVSEISGSVSISPIISPSSSISIPVPGVSSIEGTVDIITIPDVLSAVPIEFDVNANNVSIVGNTITLNLIGVNLVPGVTYKLMFDKGVIIDEDGNQLSDSDFPSFTFTAESE